MWRLLLVVAFAVPLASLGTAGAQVYPSRPITMVVPFPAGGPADVIGRIMVERMKGFLGQPVIIENMAGANGSLGTGRVARAAADGYTIVFGPWNTHVANAAVYALPYDVINDFEPVAPISSYAQLIVAKNAVPASDLRGLIAWLRANPDKASQGHPGIGSQGHLAGVFFQNTTGTRFQHVPYRGGAPMITDMLAGRIQAGIDAMPNSLPHIRSGAVRALAVLPGTRAAALPNVPSVSETLPGFEVSTWSGVGAPRGTPPEIVERLNREINAALADPGVRARIADVGGSPLVYTTSQFDAVIRADTEKWAKVIRSAGIKPE